ncbi:B-cell receptor CD22-like [Acanthochromis polyacanthus]|uniref:B-cell receptor CD22-like n=1 Tax=Acanthochromis polyacanthus TaxID=80966 RepID=UPI0022349C6B|nr:B-cell receptor CD22-like [Acanthochromis polyacanthus]
MVGGKSQGAEAGGFQAGNRHQVSEGITYSHNFQPDDNISCALKGHENHSSPSLYAPKLPSVSVSPSGEIVEGSSVNLTCSSDGNPAANYTWFKVNSRDPLSQTPQLNFSSIRSSESGQYSCTAINALGNTSSSIYINVKYAPKLPSVSVSPSGEIVEGSSVNLTCSSDANPAANYTWYKENQTLLQEPEGVYNFTSIRSEDRGTYYCKSENQFGHINTPFLYLNIQYAPKIPSVSVSPSGEIVEGSSVNLTCSSDANPAANYTWYKENEKQPLRPGSIYNFASISSEDEGNYCCKSENKHGQNSSTLFISVQYAPKLPSVSGSVSGRSVNLTCSSDANPAANYTWYKENENSPKSSGQTFTITHAGPEQSGNYKCEVQNSRGRHSSTFHLVVVQISLDDPGEGLYLRLLSFLMCSLHFKPVSTQILSIYSD